MSIYEQAMFSQRLRTRDVPEWCAFLRLWAAFNCLYGEEDRGIERDRVMQVVQRYLNDPHAQAVIDRIAIEANAIVETPPGDMRKDSSDRRFREHSERCAAIYRDQTLSSKERLSGLMGVIYQVRCNLLHGDKDPDDARDMILVRHSSSVLEAVLPALEAGIRATA
jgi:hypothetical protein